MSSAFSFDRSVFFVSLSPRQWRGIEVLLPREVWKL